MTGRHRGSKRKLPDGVTLQSAVTKTDDTSQAPSLQRTSYQLCKNCRARHTMLIICIA